MNFKTFREIKVYFINLLTKLLIVSSKKNYHQQEKKKHKPFILACKNVVVTEKVGHCSS